MVLIENLFFEFRKANETILNEIACIPFYKMKQAHYS